MAKRLVGISDIHGEYDKLCSVLEQIEPCADDTLVFMGDYIDRGKKSKDVVNKIISLEPECNCIYLIGSHEYALLHAKTDKYYDYLFWNYGGDATVESYGCFDNIFREHGDFFRSLKPYYLTPDYLFVHAGIQVGVPLEEQDLVNMVYIRSSFYNCKHNLRQKIIFGHTEFEKPQIWDDKICIDTGCGKYPDAKLTAIVIDENGENFVSSY